MKPPAAEVDAILREVVELHQRHGIYDLRLFRSYVSAEQYRRLYYKVAEQVPPGARVLDWGCGAGHFSFGLSRLGYETHGYGFYDFELRPHIRNGFQFKLGSLADPVSIPYPDDHFDAAVSVGVLEHVRETGGNEEGSLRELYRILRPGGVFLCFHFPNRNSLIEQLTARLSRVHSHSYKYDRTSIRHLCEGAGFDLLEITSYGALPRNTWNHLPARWRRSVPLARAYNLADELLRHPLSMVCQNFLFVARKPGGPPEAGEEGSSAGSVLVQAPEHREGSAEQDP